MRGAIDAEREPRDDAYPLLRQRLGTTLSLTGRFEEALPHMRAAEQGIGLLAAPEVAAEFHGNLAVVLLL
jgi:hypothetical protein